MCGFVCILDLNNNLENINISNVLKDTSNHRGPDDTGFKVFKNCQLFFRRLSIIDLDQRSNQPISNKQNTITMVFNGEIYNYIEIKKELLSLGHIFLTSGDSEVLLKSYEQWGEKCVDKLRGMFSFCIWDSKKGEFFAFRDRFGIKPLYYAMYKGIHIFASEIKDIFKIKEDKYENKDTVFKYISKGFIDDTSETFFKGVKSIKPSHYLKIQKNKISEVRYWDLNLDENNIFDKNEFEDHFNKSIELHLRSDVPIAFALSGGLDSNTITASASQILKGKNKLKAFSINPPNTFDETFWINKAIEYYDLSHSYVNINIQDTGEYFDKILYFHDEPFHSSSIFYHFLMREKINNEGFKVLMVGEGADEILSGYRRMLFPYLHDLEKRKLLLEFEDTIEKSVSFMQIEKEMIKKNYIIFKKKLEDNDTDIENINNNYFLKNYQYEDEQTAASKRYNIERFNKKKSTLKQSLIDHIYKRDLPYVLRMEDRNSMANSIESRVPFLDHNFVQYIFSIDPKYFMRAGENKKMLRTSMKNRLPLDVFNRKSKSARPGNDNYFIKQMVHKEFLDLLSSCYAENSFFDVKRIQNNLEKNNNSKRINNADLEFRVYSYLKWKRIHFS